MCDVILRRFLVTTFAVEKPQILHIVSMCVCVFVALRV